MKRDALPFFRVMAYITGVFLILLLVGMVLRYGPADDPMLSSIVAPVHGWLYMIYLIATFILTKQRGFRPGFAILTALAGTIPFASFIAERKVMQKAQEPSPVG